MKKLTVQSWMLIGAFTALFAHNLYLQSLVEDARKYARRAATYADDAADDAEECLDILERIRF